MVFYPTIRRGGKGSQVRTVSLVRFLAFIVGNTKNRLLKMLLAKNSLTNLDLIYSESGKEGY